MAESDSNRASFKEIQSIMITSRQISLKFTLPYPLRSLLAVVSDTPTNKLISLDVLTSFRVGYGAVGTKRQRFHFPGRMP